MAYTITLDDIKEAKEYLARHPIDHRYDSQNDCLDGDMPLTQIAARAYARFLELAEEKPQ